VRDHSSFPTTASKFRGDPTEEIQRALSGLWKFIAERGNLAGSPFRLLAPAGDDWMSRAGK
jgi:hypothetical protein